MPKGGAAEIGEETFESAESGASDIIPKQCSQLRKGQDCMIKGKPCKIVEMSTSKTGKHGHAKVHLVGIDIFDGKKLEDICPSTHNMDVPVVKNMNLQLLDIDEEGFLSLMDDAGNQIDHLKLPQGTEKDTDLAQDIRKSFEDGKDVHVTVIKACGQEKVIGSKIVNESK